jgi:hypothetical protein
MGKELLVLVTNRKGNTGRDGERQRFILSWRSAFAILLASIVLLLSSVSCAPSWELAMAVLKRSRSISNNVIQTGTLAAPSHLTAASQGSEFILTWLPGSNGDGYQVFGAEQLTPDCSKAPFALLGTVSGMSNTHFTDAKRKLGQGHWFCYQVRTRRGNWTSRLNNPTVSAKRSEADEAIPIAKIVAVKPNADRTATRTVSPTATKRPSMTIGPTLPTSQMPSATPIGTREATIARTPTNLMTPTRTVTATRTAR